MTNKDTHSENSSLFDDLTHLASAAFEPLEDATERPHTPKPGAGGDEGTGVTRKCDSDCHTSEAEV